MYRRMPAQQSGYPNPYQQPPPPQCAMMTSQAAAQPHAAMGPVWSHAGPGLSLDAMRASPSPAGGGPSGLQQLQCSSGFGGAGDGSSLPLLTEGDLQCLGPEPPGLSGPAPAPAHRKDPASDGAPPPWSGYAPGALNGDCGVGAGLGFAAGEDFLQSLADSSPSAFVLKREPQSGPEAAPPSDCHASYATLMPRPANNGGALEAYGQGGAGAQDGGGVLRPFQNQYPSSYGGSDPSLSFNWPY